MGTEDLEVLAAPPEQESEENATQRGRSLALIPWEVVNREVQTQKLAVKENFLALEASLSKEEFESLTEKQLGKDAEGLKSRVFPEWLTKRPDFRYVFPHFALPNDNVDELSIVALGMSKDLKQRTTYDVEKTVNLMMQLPTMSILPRELCHKLTKSIRLAKHTPGTVLFEKGDTAQMFYVVLHGRVDLVDGSETRTILSGQCFGTSALSTNLESTYSAKAVVMPPPLVRRNTLNSIGSSASLYIGMGSNGNQVPSFFDGVGEQTVVLELGAQDYRATYKLYFQTQNHHISKFLQTHVKLFEKWSKHRVNQVAPLLEQRSFKPGERIQKIGDSADEFYFVYSGGCHVEREITRTRRNRWPKRARDQIINTPRRGIWMKRYLEHEEREAKSIKSVILAEVGPGDYFGEESIIGYPKRRTTAIAHGVTEILVLHKQHVKSVFTPKLIEELRQAHEAMFTSEQDILERDEKEHKLRQEYRNLRLTAFGPDYHKRVESGRDTKKVSTLALTHRTMSKSTARLPTMLEKSNRKHTQSEQLLPSLPFSS